MDKKLKDKWVKALRSGDYLQGRGALKVTLQAGDTNPCNRGRAVKERTETFCCLGVLCDLAGGRIKAGEGYPSATFTKKIGLTEEMMEKLANKNDEGESFAKIATYIEKKMDEDMLAVEQEEADAEKEAHDNT